MATTEYQLGILQSRVDALLELVRNLYLENQSIKLTREEQHDLLVRADGDASDS